MSDAAAEARALRKAARRLVPFMGLLYFVAYLDRVNVGFAALSMNRDIGLSDAAFGLGAGIFFIGYFLFEVPSNLILEKVGARRWIARIMVSWGVLSAAMALVSGPASFNLVRFLLGVAEAGFFPGMILYLTYWFPWEQRGKIVALFMAAIPLSNAIGAPISTALLGLELWGLKGWQVMFLLEGIPAVLLGVVVWFALPDRPADARWLTVEEKAALSQALARDPPAAGHAPLDGLGAALRSPQVWRFAVVYFGVVMGNYGLGFWMPQIVKAFGGLTNVQTGWLTAAPYLLGAVAAILWGRRADRKQERVWHAVLPAFLATAGFLTAALAPTAGAKLAGMTLAAVGVSCALPMFWALPTRFLRAGAAAAGIALINSVANLAGYVGPSIMGVMKQATGAFAGGLIALAVATAVAGLVALAEPRARRRDAQA